jgi:Arc-like DNA binding domain
MASKDTVNLILRMPKPLHKRLKRQARLNNVSLNTEIIHQLEGSLGTALKDAIEGIFERWADKRGMFAANPPFVATPPMKAADKSE